MPDLRKASKSISEAAELCVKAGRLAGLYQHFITLRDTDVKAKRTSLGEKPKSLLAKFKEIDKELEAANKKAATHDYVAAGQLLDSARDKAVAAALLKEAEKNYTEEVAKLQVTVDALGKNPGRKHPTIGPDIVAAEAALAQAKKDADVLKFKEAMADLEVASVKCDSGKIKLAIRDKKAPSGNLENELKTLAGKPGGTKALDDIVGGLTEKDHPAFVLAALKARFDLEGATKEGPGKRKATVIELKGLYTVMTKVPDSHTKDNPSFKRITRKPQSEGSAYASSGGEIMMGEGHPDASGPRDLGEPSELPAVDENCKPDNSTPAPKFFDWNTLHEVAHALDDKKSYMQKNGKADDHGAWEHHGGDIMAVATAAATEFAAKSADIAKYLEDGTLPTTLPGNWAKIKLWADGVRTKKDPWENGARCAKKASEDGFIINERIYHEAYDGDWISYKAAARKQGLTGYQFRAPGEWFSELYAGYKSDKLKKGHPARKWLDKLFGVNKKKG
jgi:hypothetical protein